MRALAHYERIQRAIAGGRRFIVVSDVLVAAAGQAKRLVDLGGMAIAIGSRRGAGEMLAGGEPGGIEVHDLGLGPAPTMMDGIRTGMAALRDPPPHVWAAVEAFDPGGEALVLAPIYHEDGSYLGRRVFGARRPEWTALEDKTTVDAVWDAAGIRRAPSRIVLARPAEAWAAHLALDRGLGTVWVADNREGWHGGAEFLRWVRSKEHVEPALAHLAPVADRLRVMPFLEGVPCSIHGIVLPHEVVALRPMEMIVLRRPGRLDLHYAQAGSFWEPPAAARRSMRAVARRVGAHLQKAVGYRGSFTVDGVLTRDGFLPTELNPRFGAALGFLTAGIPGFWMYLLHCAIADGFEADWRPRLLERTILRSAARQRAAGGMAHTRRPVAESSTLRIAGSGEDWRIASEDEPADAIATLGPGPTGGIVMLRLDPRRTPVGPPSAPRVASILGFLDRHLALGIGPLEAAEEAFGSVGAH